MWGKIRAGKYFVRALFLVMACNSLALASTASDLMGLEFEDLLKVKVTSVYKKESSLQDSAAAIYVITEEDIRRSGMTTIPELLRMVPGIEVAQINHDNWAITSRGFNEIFARKLLVLIDGRSVYTPLYSGVYWDVQDTMLEDIERIEVIRGPGGTLWGANAVNGVINITTKNAAKTQGNLLTAGGGNRETGFGSYRYGDKIGENVHYRAYGKYYDREDFKYASGAGAGDGWRSGRGGFRMDIEASESNSFKVHGDGYSGLSGQDLLPVVSASAPFTQRTVRDTEVSGGNLVGKWTHKYSNQSDMSLQFYYDVARRKEIALGQTIQTFDVELQRHFAYGERQDIIWGAGYRSINDDLENSLAVSFSNSSQSNYIANFFMQDDITLSQNLLHMIVGSKFEHNSFNGFQYQPNLRLLLTPDNANTIWASVSRAVRNPSRTENNVRLNYTAFSAGPQTVFLSLVNNQNLNSEIMLAYEIGYRVQPNKQLYFDVTGFIHDYEELITQEQRTAFLETIPSPAHLVIPRQFDNKMSGRTYGVEFATNWNATSFWQLKTGFTWFNIDLNPDSSSNDTNQAVRIVGSSPRYQFNARSHLNLPYKTEFDTSLYYVDSLETTNIPSHARLDLRLGFHPIDPLEISLIAQNVQESGHVEFAPTSMFATQMPRSIFGKILWRF